MRKNEARGSSNLILLMNIVLKANGHVSANKTNINEEWAIGVRMICEGRWGMMELAATIHSAEKYKI